jgi:hypothetical protein
MKFHDALRDGKAKPGGRLLRKCTRSSSLKRSEQGFEIRLVDTRAVVFNGNPNRVLIARDSDSIERRFGVRDRVFDQVIEDCLILPDPLKQAALGRSG